LKKRGLIRYFFSMLLLLALMLPFLWDTSLALDDDEFGGYAADTLSIQVGYPGGPYFDKATFTVSDLETLGVVYADYTFIDNMPSVVIDHVKGVRLADVVDGAGIDIGAVKSFKFWIADKSESYYTSFSKSELLDTPRYCYYSLPDNFDYDAGEGNEYATSDAQRVDTVLAIADDWNRAIAGATFGSDYMSLNSNTRFRLIFGQTDAVTRTATRSAKWVYSIAVELRGEPSVTLNTEDLDITVGNMFQVEATVQAGDPVMTENTPVTWSSSDDGIASVDDNGNITANSEGSAVITAEFLGVTAAVTVNASLPDVTAPPISAAPGPGGVSTPGKSGHGGSKTTTTTPVSAEPAGPDVNAPAPVSPETPFSDITQPESISPAPPSESMPPPSPPSPPPTPPDESASPEVTPPEPQAPPDNTEKQKTAAIPPIIGTAAICLFAGGGLFSALRSKGKQKPPEDQAPD